MTCSVVLVDEDGWIVATDTTTGIASQGKTREEALSNLKEALELFYEDVPEDKRVSRRATLTTLEVFV